MRIFTFLLLVLLSSRVISMEVFLEFERKCSIIKDDFKFECKKSTRGRTLIFSENGKWYGKRSSDSSIWKLDIVKEDEYILVLGNTVFFSGTSLLHLMKATGKFYWSEVAYSEILEEDEATVHYGSIFKVNK